MYYTDKILFLIKKYQTKYSALPWTNFVNQIGNFIQLINGQWWVYTGFAADAIFQHF